MKTNKVRNEAGFLIIKLVLLAAVMVVGYIVITRVLNSRQVKSATNTVDSARDKAGAALE